MFHERSHAEIASMMHEVASTLEEAANSQFDDLRILVKRAKYFTRNLSIGGQCSPIGKTGLSIPVRNGLWLLDLQESKTEEDFKGELYIFFYVARLMNKWIDSHMVEGDEEAVWALGAFLSRIWFDVEKLQEKRSC